MDPAGTTIIKLGGSVVSRIDCEFDFGYILKLKEILKKRIVLGERFAIVLGGGYTMRKYRDLAREQGNVTTPTDLHWIGATVNVLHAELVRAVFSDLAIERPIVYEQYYDENLIIDLSHRPVVIGGGGRPGHSSDVDAILLADKLGTDMVITLKNIDYLYDEDPVKNHDARKVENATWEEYLEIIDNIAHHNPGASYIVDPIAARMAQKKDIKFIIIKGADLGNFENLISGGEFKGSIISS